MSVYLFVFAPAQDSESISITDLLVAKIRKVLTLYSAPCDADPDITRLPRLWRTAESANINDLLPPGAQSPRSPRELSRPDHRGIRFIRRGGNCRYRQYFNSSSYKGFNSADPLHHLNCIACDHTDGPVVSADHTYGSDDDSSGQQRSQAE